jgi:hypothetical protein
MTKMAEIRLLRSATTRNPFVGTEGLADIDIDSPSPIQREPKNTHPKHVNLDTSFTQLHFMAGVIFLAEQAEQINDEQYEPPEEINIE